MVWQRLIASLLGLNGLIVAAGSFVSLRRGIRILSKGVFNTLNVCQSRK